MRMNWLMLTLMFLVLVVPASVLADNETAPYINNASVITYDVFDGYQMTGSANLTDWNVSNEVFYITASGLITYPGNLTDGVHMTSVYATSPENGTALGTFTLEKRVTGILDIWSCPSSGNYWFLYLTVAMALTFIVIAEVMRLRLFGMLGGIGITSLYLFIGACQPLLTLFLPIGGILLIIYYATAD
jgi:hypothetical protein